MSTDPADQPTADPRDRNDGLGWVTRALFPDRRARLHVSNTRRQPNSPTGEITEQYAVLPSIGRARVLMPLGRPRAAAASFRTNDGLRPRRTRGVHLGLGALARLGAFDVTANARLTAVVPEGIPPSELLLTAHVAEALDQPDLAGACVIRPPHPNLKPTLNLFGPQGERIGYAKIGWNDATRALVRAEATALQQIPRTASHYPIVPGLLLADDWSGQSTAVIEPLPRDIRGVPTDAPPRVTEALIIARRGRPPAEPQVIDGSAFLRRVAAATSTPEAIAAAGDRPMIAVERLRQRYASTRVEFGDWHGDWVTWNMGTVAGRLVVWDWEHSSGHMPVGADLAHDAFQRSWVIARQPVATAVAAAEEQLARFADQIGLDCNQREVVLVAYLIEAWLRTLRLAVGGAGWDSRLHPALLNEFEARLR